MPKSTTLANALLNAVLRNTSYTSPSTVYVALFNGDPASSGTEATGGSYARQAVTFAAPSGGSVSNTANVTFTNMPAMTVSYVAIYDSLTGGNRLYSAAAASSKVTNSTDTLTIAGGALVVTES